MALAIDTKHLVEEWMPYEEKQFNEKLGSRGRFQLQRVCVYGIAVHGSLLSVIDEDEELDKAALDWQADQDDDQDDLEVFHHLKQHAASLSSIRDVLSANDRTKAAATTLFTSVQSPTLTGRTQGRPPASFYRYSHRMRIAPGLSLGLAQSSMKGIIPGFDNEFMFWPWIHVLKILQGHNSADGYFDVVWHLQLDFLDLHAPRIHPSGNPRKRRRTLNPFLQVSSRCVENTSRENQLPNAKRFKGVRYRPDHNRWVAEMRPPKSKDKVSLGEFHSRTEAARAVDAAFHHYGKTHLLNFADTPRILSTLPTSAGLKEKEKLKLVKEQAKWLASKASTLPTSTPTSPSARGTSGAMSSLPVEVPESSRGFITDPLGFRSLSQISSWLNCDGTDDADDANSQPQPWIHWDPVTGIEANGVETLDPNIALADHAGVVNGFGQGRSVFQWSVETAIADPCDTPISPKYSSGTLTNFVSSPGVEQPSAVGSMCMDFLIMSPPAPTFQARSPYDFQGDVARHLLQQQNFGCE